MFLKHLDAGPQAIVLNEPISHCFHSLKKRAPFTVPHLQEPRHCQLFNQCDPPTSALTLHHIASKWEALGKRQLSSISGELTFLSVLGYFGGIPLEK